jgi:hypothetical protein
MKNLASRRRKGELTRYSGEITPPSRLSFDMTIRGMEGVFRV